MAAPARRESRAQGPLVLLGATVVIWGTGYWPTAVAAEHGSALMVTGLRLAPAALVMLAAVFIMRAKLPRGRMLGWALLTGLLMVALFQWGLTEAIARAGPGNGAILINTNPLIVLVLAWIFLRERLSPLGVVGLLAGFAGVVLMVWSQLGGSVETSQLLIGSALALIAALGWAIGVLVLRKLSQRPGGIDMVGITAVQFLLASLILLPTAFAVDGTSTTDWGSGTLWGTIVWIGPAATLGVLFFYLALKHLSAAKTSSALFLVPAVAVIVEIARGSSPGALVLAGMVVAVIGVALAVVPGEQLASLWRWPAQLRRRPLAVAEAGAEDRDTQ
ncbi:MAG: DMT family transporter [Gaiellaceae bacterium]